jgi:hypothetical protein
MCDGCPDITVYKDELIWSCRMEEQKQTSRNQTLDFTGQRLLHNKWTLGAQLSFEQNTELGIQLRTSIIPQVGYIYTFEY